MAEEEALAMALAASEAVSRVKFLYLLLENIFCIHSAVNEVKINYLTCSHIFFAIGIAIGQYCVLLDNTSRANNPF